MRVGGPALPPPRAPHRSRRLFRLWSRLGAPHAGLRFFHQKSTFPNAIHFRFLYSAFFLTYPPKIWGNETFVVHRVEVSGLVWGNVCPNMCSGLGATCVSGSILTMGVWIGPKSGALDRLQPASPRHAKPSRSKNPIDESFHRPYGRQYGRDIGVLLRTR